MVTLILCYSSVGHSEDIPATTPSKKMFTPGFIFFYKQEAISSQKETHFSVLNKTYLKLTVITIDNIARKWMRVKKRMLKYINKIKLCIVNTVNWKKWLELLHQSKFLSIHIPVF